MSTASIEVLQKDVKECIDEGVKQYKTLMDSLLIHFPNQPFKDSQLRKYHTENLNIVTSAMDTVYKDIISTLITEKPHIKFDLEQVLTAARKRLTTLAKKQFNEIYLRKHEIHMDNVGRKVKDLTIQAEKLYDELSKEGQLKLQGKPQFRSKVQVEHKKWEKKTINLFDKLLRDNNLDLNEFWNLELKHKLKEHLDDILEDHPKNLGLIGGEETEVETSTSLETELKERAKSPSLTPGKRKGSQLTSHSPAKVQKLDAESKRSEKKSLKAKGLQNEEDSTVIEFVKQDLLQCIDEGVKHYKSRMDTLLLSKQPLKDTLLQDYHLKTVEVIKKSLRASFEDITTTESNTKTQIQQLLTDETDTLEKLINKNFKEVYLRKYEIQTEDFLKKVKSCTTQAELLYDEKVEALQIRSKSRKDATMLHNNCVEEANQRFSELLQEKGIESGTFFGFELKSKFKECLEDLLEDIREDSPSKVLNMDERELDVEQKVSERLNTLSKNKKPQFPTEGGIQHQPRSLRQRKTIKAAQPTDSNLKERPNISKSPVQRAAVKNAVQFLARKQVTKREDTNQAVSQTTANKVEQQVGKKITQQTKTSKTPPKKLAKQAITKKTPPEQTAQRVTARTTNPKKVVQQATAKNETPKKADQQATAKKTTPKKVTQQATSRKKPLEKNVTTKQTAQRSARK